MMPLHTAVLCRNPPACVSGVFWCLWDFSTWLCISNWTELLSLSTRRAFCSDSQWARGWELGTRCDWLSPVLCCHPHGWLAGPVKTRPFSALGAFHPAEEEKREKNATAPRGSAGIKRDHGAASVAFTSVRGDNGDVRGLTFTVRPPVLLLFLRLSLTLRTAGVRYQKAELLLPSAGATFRVLMSRYQTCGLFSVSVARC